MIAKIAAVAACVVVRALGGTCQTGGILVYSRHHASDPDLPSSRLTTNNLTVYLDVDAAELERRLIARWLTHGHDAAAARRRALGNDIPNARLVAEDSLPATITIRNG